MRGSVAELIQSKTALWTNPKKETYVFFSLSVVWIHSPVEVLLSERKKKSKSPGRFKTKLIADERKVNVEPKSQTSTPK